VLYSSATGASEPLNLAYMLRLLPPGFKNPFDMVKALSTAGLGSLELFCMGLKVRCCGSVLLCALCAVCCVLCAVLCEQSYAVSVSSCR
jgi:hypothetical protein